MEIGTSNPADIPDDTLVYVCGFGETTVGALRAMQPEFITTKKAEELFSYRRETWAGWANEGLIEGARYDRMWRLPVTAATPGQNLAKNTPFSVRTMQSEATPPRAETA